MYLCRVFHMHRWRVLENVELRNRSIRKEHQTSQPTSNQLVFSSHHQNSLLPHRNLSMPSAVCDSFALHITSSLLEAIQRHNFAASKVLGIHLSVFHTSDNTSISDGHCHNISHNDDSYELSEDNFDEIITEKRESYIICLEELMFSHLSQK